VATQLPPPQVEVVAPPAYSPPAGGPVMFPTISYGPETPAAGQLQPGLFQPGLSPVGLQQPAPVMPVAPPGQLPPPNALPFGDDKVRLPRLQNNVLGSTPAPTQRDLEEYRQFVEGVVDPRNTLDLIEGRARVILLKAIPTRTQIADEKIAAFRLLEPGTQMTMIGVKPGITVLNLWFQDPANKDKEKIISYLVRVFPDPEAKDRLEAIYKALEIEINKAFPKSRVRLALVGDKLMVSGQAHDVADATQILRIARANSPNQGGQGQGNAANRPPLATLGPTGQPYDPLRPDATPGVEAYQAEGGPNVINNLRIPGEQQVMLRVMVAEVNRAAARSIGVNFSIINNQGTEVFSQRTGSLLAAAAGAGGGGGNLPVNLDNGQIPIAINALRTLNYARSLAEPNLTAMNGQTAFFLAGGQFPVPVVGGFGAFGAGTGLQGVQFVPFGVQLSFTPIITDRDRIRLTMFATVSTRNDSAGTSIGGANVPGLNTRTFSTTVELREGQTMAVAGLIQNSLGATASRVPLFGDLPYVGRLFSLQLTSHSEQELIVLVTPELVHPLESKELMPIPGSDIFEPGDMEFYLAGRLESRRSYDYRSAVRTDIHRMLRYRRCEDIYIVGPSGHVEPPEPAAVVPAGGK
jgi:pilus assembly protein CpaC